MPSLFKKIFGIGKKKKKDKDKDKNKNSKKKGNEKEKPRSAEIDKQKLNKSVSNSNSYLNQNNLNSLIQPPTVSNGVSPGKSNISNHNSRASPYNPNVNNMSGWDRGPAKPQPVKHNIVDLDDSSFTDTDGEELSRSAHEHGENSALSHRALPPLNTNDNYNQGKVNHLPLSQQRLQQHQMNMKFQSPAMPPNGKQLHRLSNGKLVALDPSHPSLEKADSPASTDFCLSTDMEDEEYNRVRGKFFFGKGMLGNSGAKSAFPEPPRDTTSPKSDSTEEYVLFPGILNDASQEDNGALTSSHKRNMDITSVAGETMEDMSAWTGSKANTSDAMIFHFPEDEFTKQLHAKSDVSQDTNMLQMDSSGFLTASTEENVKAAPKRNTALADQYPDSEDSEFESEKGKSASPKRTQRPHMATTALFDELSQTSSSITTPTTTPLNNKEVTDMLPPFAENGWLDEPVSENKSDAFSPRSHQPQADPFAPSRLDIISPRSNASPRARDATDRLVVTPSPEHDGPSDTRSTHSRSSTNVSALAKEKVKRRNRRRREKETRQNTGLPVSPLLMTSPPSHSQQRRDDESSSSQSDDEANNDWLFQEIQGTIGPVGAAADLESLSGRSTRSNRSKSSLGGKSHKSSRSIKSTKSNKSTKSTKSSKSHRSTTSRKSSSHGKSSSHAQSSSSSRRSRHRSSADSVSSRTSRNSRNSHYSHRSTRSALSHMSDASRSVAKDLLRLEMQLAMVEKDNPKSNLHKGSTASVGSYGSYGYTASSVGGLSTGGSMKSKARKTSSTPRRNKFVAIAPPGKLGIILANKSDNRGTVVSGVRSSSALCDKVFPGDRIIMIDGEDVSRMTVSEITTVMARKIEFERTLTIMTTPTTGPSRGAPTSSSYTGNHIPNLSLTSRPKDSAPPSYSGSASASHVTYSSYQTR